MKAIDYGSKRCLIVEDRRPFLMLLRGLVTSLGATKITMELSAEAAVRACKQVKYDIVICDLHLGTNRKNGFEFLEEIRTHRLVKPSTVFIMISGDSARSIVLGSIEKQPDDYLVKPFSQAQLNSRITKAINRRTALGTLYSKLDSKQYKVCVEICKDLIQTEKRYRNFLLQILVQLYWKTETYSQAEQVLSNTLESRPVQWAIVSLAKTKLLQQDYEGAIDLAKRAINNQSNSVEAYDIIADAYLKSNKKPEALKYISEALSLSPLSIDRHFRVCEIARENKNYELAMNSSKSIYELSKRSIHKNVNHMCGYIRSIIDAAEHSDNKNTKNKYMHESLLALQRAKHDDVSRNQPDDFDFEIFESVVQARLLHIEGKTTEAKKLLEESQIEIEKTFSEYPVAIAPDSLKLMLDLGDFEEAHKLTKIIANNKDKVDESILYLTQSELGKQKGRRNNYVAMNKKGVGLYSKGKYLEAYQNFEEAKQLSPLNIGVNLNLLQCLVKLIENADKAEGQHIIEARSTYNFLKNMPLKAIYREKLANIKEDVEKAIK